MLTFTHSAACGLSLQMWSSRVS